MLRLLEKLGTSALALALVAGARTAVAWQSGAPPSQSEIGKELEKLYADDQKDQNDPRWTEATGAEFGARQKVRCDRAREIVRAGLLGAPIDWYHAAMLLQHGSTSDDYLLGHILTVRSAAAGEVSSRFLAAATLDRFLQSVKRPQIFSTQSASADPKAFDLMEPFDTSMSQSIRALFDLPPLPKDGAAPAERKHAKSPSAKGLPKLLKEATSEAGDAGTAGAPSWLVQVRELVDSGALEKPQDYFLAAEILRESATAEDLLDAHVLAVASALLGHEQGLRLSAETLDRFLLSAGQKQRFGTCKDDGQVPLEPSDTSLHEAIRNAYFGAGAKYGDGPKRR